MNPNAYGLLTGAPSFEYSLHRFEDDELWDKLHNAYLSEYHISLGTYGQTHELNKCNIRELHAFSLLASFYLRNDKGEILHRMHMVRDPTSETKFSLRWNSDDYYRWKDKMKS